MKIHIKNMVCIRCKMTVMSELEKLGLHSASVELGEIEIIEDLSPELREVLKTELMKSGLELLEDKESILVEKIKNLIIELIHYGGELPKVNIPELLSDRFNYNYNYLSNLFKKIHGHTIEHFIIHHKIELVKELLVNDELTICEIAYRLHYCSVAHLSNQFKQVTGMSPSQFKSLKGEKRINLDEIQ